MERISVSHSSFPISLQRVDYSITLTWVFFNLHPSAHKRVHKPVRFVRSVKMGHNYVDATPWRGGGGGGWWVLLGILGGAVSPGSSNPDPISDQKMLFSTPVFRQDL